MTGCIDEPLLEFCDSVYVRSKGGLGRWVFCHFDFGWDYHERGGVGLPCTAALVLGFHPRRLFDVCRLMIFMMIR